MKLVLILLCLFGMGAQAAEKQNIEHYFTQLKQHPKQLQRFLIEFPKGGDLHNHFSGATYAENLLRNARGEQLCIAPPKFVAQYKTDCQTGYSIHDILTNDRTREKIITAWSLKSFKPTQQSAHDHFFQSFNKFSAIVAKHHAEVLTEILIRAAKQHVNYLELMMTSDNNASGLLAKKLGNSASFALLEKKLLKNNLQTIVNKIPHDINTMEQHARKLLNCDHKSSAACNIKVRYLYQVLREQRPEQVFAQLLTGFLISQQDPKFVGINIVMPEDGKIALLDYKLHMKMIGYLHKQFPKVHISLHAGELNQQISTMKDRQFHIRSAIKIGHAERIGHGVDIKGETDAIDTLKEMAKRNILVEINLTSNQSILNIKGKQHPLKLYLKYHVPVSLSTDDAGILRTTLNNEYIKAANEYDLDYKTLKTMNRNSLTYSFLPGESLWLATKLNPACQKDILGSDTPSSTCKNLLKNSEKARIQWQLEKQLSSFEKRVLN